jgi:hypothetical protein
MGALIHASVTRGSVQKDVTGFLVFGIFWLLLLVLAIFLISARAELTATEVTRKSAFGERTLRVSDVTSALLYSGARGGLSLRIRTARDSIMFTSSSFSNAQLRQMQEFIRMRAAEIGRQIETAMPPRTAQQVRMLIALYLGILLATIALVAVFSVSHPRGVPPAHAASAVETCHASRAGCVTALKGTDIDQPRNLAKSVTVE